MEEQPMLTRDLVLRLCETATEFDPHWVRSDDKAVAPFTAPRDLRLIRAIVASARALGTDRLLVCRTRAEHSYEPVTVVVTDPDALLDLIRSWGKEPTDFLVAVEDLSAALLVTEARLTIAAGPADFVRQFVGADIAQARDDFVTEARGSHDAQLIRAAHRYDCVEETPQHARGERGRRPDLAERLTRWADTQREAHPRRVRVLRTGRGVAGWAALATLLVAGLLLSVPAVLLPLAVGAIWLLAQLSWLSRSRTVTFAVLMRMLALGALVTIPVAVAERAIAGAVGMDHRDLYASAYIGVPVEEVAKLLPLLLVWFVARRRYQRLAAVDFLLLAAASGAGFQLAERAMQLGYLAGFVGAGIVDAPPIPVFSLLPGGFELLDTGTRFSGHGVTTALVGVTIGLAVVAWRRCGAWARLLLCLLPPLAFWWATVEHMNANAAVIQAMFPPADDTTAITLTPLTQTAFAFTGNGYATRWVLLLLLVLAVVLDYRMAHAAEGVAPRLPGRAPLAGLVRRAHGRAIRVRVHIPGDYAELFRRIALFWARLPVILAEALAVAAHEVAVQVVAARHGPRALYASWRYLPRRRAYAMGAARAAGGRAWRRFPSRERLSEIETDLATRMGVGPRATVAAGVAVAAATLPAVLPEASPDTTGATAAYVALYAGGALDWYATLSSVGQGWVVAALVALLYLLVAGWDVPRELPSARAFFREPHRQLGACLGALAPGQVPYALTGLVGLLLPGAVDRLLRPAPARSALSSSAASRPSAGGS